MNKMKSWGMTIGVLVGAWVIGFITAAVTGDVMWGTGVSVVIIVVYFGRKSLQRKRQKAREQLRNLGVENPQDVDEHIT